MADIRLVGSTVPTRKTSDDNFIGARGLRDGSLVSADWLEAMALEGRVMYANGGTASSPITFAGAYDADAPDFHLHVPASTLVYPVSIRVYFEAVGTEATMEIIGLASATGDSTATGTAVTIYSSRIDGGGPSSNCTATAAVDAAGVTDPNAGNLIEFWREMRPLTDTVATTENDRLPLLFEWSSRRDGPAPVIGDGGCLAVYANSQAGTGFITVAWVELPSNTVI